MLKVGVLTADEVLNTCQVDHLGKVPEQQMSAPLTPMAMLLVGWLVDHCHDSSTYCPKVEIDRLKIL